MSGDAKPKPVASEPRKRRAIHSSIVRLTHWINAAAMVVMVTSGWQIYNASPIFDFKFPAWMTLGGWLAGAIAWHFAAMWVLAINLHPSRDARVFVARRKLRLCSDQP